MGNLDEVFVLEVGKQYHNRLGNPILIKSVITDTSSPLYKQGYRFIDDQDRPYTPRGRSTFGDIGNMDIERSIPGVFPGSSKSDKKDLVVRKKGEISLDERGRDTRKSDQQVLATFGQGQSADYRSDCPHAPGSDLYDAWHAGFDEAERVYFVKSHPNPINEKG